MGPNNKATLCPSIKDNCSVNQTKRRKQKRADPSKPLSSSVKWARRPLFSGETPDCCRTFVRASAHVFFTYDTVLVSRKYLTRL